MHNYFNVRPRYSPGSPAMVDGPTAAMVANDEKDGHERTLAGIYGDDARTKAEGDTLRGLAERVTERSDCWLVQDLVTDEVYIRPFEVQGESPLRQSRRFARLRTRYGLPLESELPTKKEDAR